MTDLTSLTGGPSRANAPKQVRGHVSKEPAHVGDRLTVTVDNYVQTLEFEVPATNWAPIEAQMPIRGSACLIEFDDEDDAWIVSWENGQRAVGSPLVAELDGLAGGGPGGGDLNYVHAQGTPSTSWVVTHNLGKYASVVVVDSGDSVVIPSIHYDSLNSITLTFGSPTSGKAFVN